ncbi:MAG: acetyltransferase [Candidatus Cloacimonetes bacterium]|nr:acetyltransferase [Candidatus Cloacimonadota bacterium]
MGKGVIILGGLGNGSVVASAILDARKNNSSEWEFAGYLNDRIETGRKIEGLPVLGKLDQVGNFLERGYYFINTIYRIEGQKERIQLFESLKIPEERMATFIHPTAYIAPDVEIGNGTAILPQVIISPGVKIGRCCLIMSGAFIGHNDFIDDHCHLAAQSCLSSMISIGRGVHIGLNATVREGLKIGAYATLGMGSVLLNDIGKNEIWVGNPARFLKMVT